MSGNNSADPARIHALTGTIVDLLEPDGQTPVAPPRVREEARSLVETYQEVLNLGSKQLVSLAPGGFRDTLAVIQAAYADWRDIDAAFTRLVDGAYRRERPKEDLLLDTIHAELSQRIGDPIAALYSRLHAVWSEHLEGAPWDAYMATVHDADLMRLTSGVRSLVHGDELDVEDAIETLTGSLRHAFGHFLENQANGVELLEESLWMRPEIVVMNDYWRPNSQQRLLDTLTRQTSTFSGAFATVRDLMATNATDEDGANQVVAVLSQVDAGQRLPYLRCLALHPDRQVRRFAVNFTDTRHFWNVLTPAGVPCATILSVLEKVALGGDETAQKIFFRTIHRRLHRLTSRSDVVYARGIVRILIGLRFFMEDEYFESLHGLIDYLRQKERLFEIRDGLLQEYYDAVEREKHRVGARESNALDLGNVPAVVLRKLARDGHFWKELAAHPMFKIARETIPHINSPARAASVARNPRVNQDVLRAIGRNRALFHTLPARFELLSNPRTPVAVSMEYVNDLSRTDAERLLRRATVHPELRPHLRRRVER